MTPADAAKLLDLPADATPEQLEARFLEIRRKLEDKIAKAPTPGLQAKYRESLTDITTAFETLTLAADSSALPVLKKEAGSGRPEAGSAATPPPGSDSGLRPPVSGVPPAKRAKSGGKEFIIVALIAVVVLGAGGWWVMKTRAENAEKERIAAEAKATAERQAAEAKAEAERQTAEAKAEAERKAEAARLAAEARQQAEADAKARALAAAQAEQARLEQLGLRLRTRISELNLALDVALKTETQAERDFAELKAEERSLQREARGNSTPDLRAAQAELQAQDRYVTWLRDHLAASPARATRARLGELAAAKAWDEVATQVDAYAAGIAELQTSIAAKRAELLTLTGSLTLTSEPSGVPYVILDSYGRSRPGQTPADLSDVPFGKTTVTFQRPGWPEQTKTVTIARDRPASATVDLVGGALSLASAPFPVEFLISGQGRSDRGQTPTTLPELPPGKYEISYSRVGWPSQTSSATVTRGTTATNEIHFAATGSIKIDSQPTGASVIHRGLAVGTTPLVLSDLPPGPVSYDLSLADYRPISIQGTVESGKETALSATLRAATLTPEEAFDKFSRDANGTWVSNTTNYFGGANTLYLRFVSGSRTLSFEMTGFGGSVRNLTMVDYDAKNRIVLVAFGGMDALNGKVSLRIDGDTLLWGKGDLSKNQILFRRSN